MAKASGEAAGQEEESPDRGTISLLYLIKYTRPNGHEHTLKQVDKLAPFSKRMGYQVITTEQLGTWELIYGNPSNCSEVVLSYFLHRGSQDVHILADIVSNHEAVARLRSEKYCRGLFGITSHQKHS